MRGMEIEPTAVLLFGSVFVSLIFIDKIIVYLEVSISIFWKPDYENDNEYFAFNRA